MGEILGWLMVIALGLALFGLLCWVVDFKSAVLVYVLTACLAGFLYTAEILVKGGTL